jgi:hypothetical protein
MLTLLMSDFGFGPSRLAHADNRATDSPIATATALPTNRRARQSI